MKVEVIIPIMMIMMVVYTVNATCFLFDLLECFLICWDYGLRVDFIHENALFSVQVSLERVENQIASLNL